MAPELTVRQGNGTIEYKLIIPMSVLKNPRVLTLDMQQRLAEASERGDIAEALMIFADMVRNINKEMGNG